MIMINEARSQFEKFKALFEGKDFSSIEEIVEREKLSYGALKGKGGIVDVNYKNLNVTILNHDGKCHIWDRVEVYDENDQFKGIYEL